jgi:arsenic resistance protein ArsH
MSSTVFPSVSPRTSPQRATARLASSNGDLNNLSAVRPAAKLAVDAAYVRQSLAIQGFDDDPEIRRQYRPFLLPEEIAASDWIANLEMSTAVKMAYEEMHRVNGGRLKVLVLYGSLRERCVAYSEQLLLLPGLTTHQLLLEAPCL